MSSSNLIRCPSCLGKKEIMGAGMIFHKCKPCLGVGHIEHVEPAPEVETENVTRRTRKKNNDDTACQPDA